MLIPIFSPNSKVSVPSSIAGHVSTYMMSIVEIVQCETINSSDFLKIPHPLRHLTDSFVRQAEHRCDLVTSLSAYTLHLKQPLHQHLHREGQETHQNHKTVEHGLFPFPSEPHYVPYIFSKQRTIQLIKNKQTHERKNKKQCNTNKAEDNLKDDY